MCTFVNFKEMLGCQIDTLIVFYPKNIKQIVFRIEFHIQGSPVSSPFNRTMNEWSLYAIGPWYGRHRTDKRHILRVSMYCTFFRISMVHASMWWWMMMILPMATRCGQRILLQIKYLPISRQNAMKIAKMQSNLNANFSTARIAFTPIQRHTQTHTWCDDPIDHRASMFAFVMTTKTFCMAFNAIRYVFCNLQRRTPSTPDWISILVVAVVGVVDELPHIHLIYDAIWKRYDCCNSHKQSFKKMKASWTKEGETKWEW